MNTLTSLDILNILKPETDLEVRIVSDPEFLDGALYGEPRPGHPEGKVVYHIREVLNNVDEYHLGDASRRSLRLIALIHDTFKYKVDERRPKSGENHHAMIARRFAEKFELSDDLLDIIELHDEAFNAWQKGNRDGRWDKAEARANVLIARLATNLGLYIAFYKCDNLTGDKSQENYDWFIKLVP